ncbi:hypothetical protein [Rhizobium sp. NPDC090279]|uniref:hypothetical protein n=1 Tax=Rhizobium sp. NPDC090279 TaxID=3364499 RepID=UPI00383A9B79
MIRILLLLSLTMGLAGCGSISHPLPKCDGYSRRPLNRSMWQWENDGKVDKAASHATSYAQEPMSPTPAAFAHLDVTSSYRPCEGK